MSWLNLHAEVVEGTANCSLQVFVRREGMATPQQYDLAYFGSFQNPIDASFRIVPFQRYYFFVSTQSNSTKACSDQYLLQLRKFATGEIAIVSIAPTSSASSLSISLLPLILIFAFVFKSL